MFKIPGWVYDAIYDRPEFKDYATEASRVEAIVRAELPAARTLLDVACGTGLHAAHLAASFAVRGFDVDDGLLARARERLPDTRFDHADMESFELGERFDAITCLFSAIGYVPTIERLEATFANLARHLTPGGVLLVEPWLTPDVFEVGRVDVEVVEHERAKVVRMTTTGLEDHLSIIEMRYLVGLPDRIDVFTERHRMALFPTADLLDAMQRAGLDARPDSEGLMGRGLLLGRAPDG